MRMEVVRMAAVASNRRGGVMDATIESVGLDDGRSECNKWIAEMQDGLSFQPLIDFLERLKEPVACSKLPKPPAVEGGS